MAASKAASLVKIRRKSEETRQKIRQAPRKKEENREPCCQDLFLLSCFLYFYFEFVTVNENLVSSLLMYTNIAMK